MSNFVKKTEQFAFFNSIFLREPLKCRGEMRQHLPTDNELHLLPLAGSQYQTKQMTWYYLIDPQVMSKAQLATRNRH